MSVGDDGIRGGREFPVTSWSVILHARDPGSPEHVGHLRRLVELYWRPVYRVIRFAWRKGHDDAKDLTQEFFATVVFDRAMLDSYSPARGSFRSFLRTALARFLTDAVRGASRQKRGGDLTIVSLDSVTDDGAGEIATATDLTPDQLFDVAFRDTVMIEALQRLRHRLEAASRGHVFEIFRGYEVDPPDEGVSYATFADRHGLTVPQVKHALREARAAYRDVLGEVVRDYVDDPEDLASELRDLLAL